MKVVVGLGNPGEEYVNNRHNVGFMVIDELANGIWRMAYGEKPSWESKFESLILKSADYLLVKPQMFMNRSGEAVAKLVNFYKVEWGDLWIVHDDLDIRLGEYKIQRGVGPKVHNGLTSVEEQLGRCDFWRVRVGVDNRPVGEARTPGDEYVLSDFTAGERKIVEGVIGKLVENDLGALLA